MKLKELPKSLYHTLRLKSLSSTTLSSYSEESVPVIVSLTTIPSRINKVDITIRSILMQTKRPKKVVLWLPESLRGKIPKSLDLLQQGVFEIKFSHLTCSHKKLIHSLQEYPDDVIVTCDDDFIYNQNWLDFLYNQHIKYPKSIVANQARMIRYSKEGDLLPYKNWIYDKDKGASDKSILPIGANGVLYPPGALHKDVFDENLFFKLAPKADDLWFKAMALLQHTESRLSDKIPPIPIPIMGTQKVSLKKENIDKGKNVIQWKALQDYFNLKL
ncbi:hypothetical protein [Aquimarina pacifica]|uniref:hypothetical protein n=1 Tax=Aquimarina pacifica TaxID=1296415 RepID=UPI00046F34CC|nr:hypothetical protein [Aquimarina pacifica]